MWIICWLTFVSFPYGLETMMTMIESVNNTNRMKTAYLMTLILPPLSLQVTRMHTSRDAHWQRCPLAGR